MRKERKRKEARGAERGDKVHTLEVVQTLFQAIGKNEDLAAHYAYYMAAPLPL